jgi:hypothetical protein
MQIMQVLVIDFTCSSYKGREAKSLALPLFRSHLPSATPFYQTPTAIEISSH